MLLRCLAFGLPGDLGAVTGASLTSTMRSVEGSFAPRSFRRQNSPVQSHTSQSQISAMAYHENSDTLLAVYNDPDSQARMSFYKYSRLPTLGAPLRPSSTCLALAYV